MITFRMLYIPRTAGLSPRPSDLQHKTVNAPDARRAARIAAGFERRTGARVLTITEATQ
jgi:hypothetical protein